MVWTIWKVVGPFVVFSNARLWGKETNMAVASMMTCKIGLIWRHMKTLYRLWQEVTIAVRYQLIYSKHSEWDLVYSRIQCKFLGVLTFIWWEYGASCPLMETLIPESWRESRDRGSIPRVSGSSFKKIWRLNITTGWCQVAIFKVIFWQYFQLGLTKTTVEKKKKVSFSGRRHFFQIDTGGYWHYQWIDSFVYVKYATTC